jgi:membrane associated rhomboid family serine protease
MSWEQRPYAYNDEPSYGPRHSWLGGLPRPGKAVKWIMIANVAVFVVCLMTGGSDGPLYRLLEMRTDLVARGQVWRLFTFTYLHDQSTVGHIFFNMLGLYFLGMSLERAWGARRFFIFYTLGGFVGVLVYLMVTLFGWLDPRVPLVGASGGVLAVLGVCAVLFPGIQIILIFFPVPIRTAVLIFTVFYAFNLVTRGANAGGDACHLAGMAFGVAWGYRGRLWTEKFGAWKHRFERRAAESRRRSEAQIQVEVDRILAKVHNSGIQSLTRREKAVLEEATRRERQSTGRR